MTVAEGTARPRPVSLSIGEYGGRADDFVCDLLELSATKRSIDLDVGLIDSATPGLSPTLKRLAAVRAEHCYGLRLSCRLRGAATEYSLLRAAGIRSVLLDPESVPQEQLASIGTEVGFLRQLQLVSGLTQEGISVSWMLAVGQGRLTDIATTAELLSCCYHLPPPEGLWSPGMLTVDATLLCKAIEQWKSAYTPGTLTYGRGPGFIRIFDRRRPEQTVTYVTLEGAQADVFMAASVASPIERLVHAAGSAPLVALQRFLDRLVARRILCRTSGRHYQSLPTRRQIEERWVEGEP